MQKNRSFLTKSEKVDVPVGYCKTPSFISFNSVSPCSAYSEHFKLPKLKLLTLMEITKLKSQYQ